MLLHMCVCVYHIFEFERENNCLFHRGRKNANNLYTKKKMLKQYNLVSNFKSNSLDLPKSSGQIVSKEISVLCTGMRYQFDKCDFSRRVL